jgi:hypothetical protein
MLNDSINGEPPRKDKKDVNKIKAKTPSTILSPG